jgi:glycosyltransferase involved in cell wall biosynthesis
VFPSYAEAYGLSLLEAMAVRLPVIASNCDGVLDIVEDGKTGILIPPRQAEPLIQAAEKLVQEEKIRKEYAWNGYKHVTNHFTANQMIEQFEALYVELLES